jgi:DNA-binding transcriptional MerR regulator
MKSEWSLSEAARLLGQPQHRLIYLCEKGVIVPDLGEARGRGSSRRFSSRNLLEFEVALRLRELTVPVSSIAAVLYALRGFEAKVARESPGFRLPDGLRSGRAPDLRVMLTDQGRLYFSLGPERGGRKIYGGLDFGRLAASRRTRRRSRVAGGGSSSLALPALAGVRLAERVKARVEVSVTRIARDLNLER